MSYHIAPSSGPISGAKSQDAAETFVSQSRETGDVVPAADGTHQGPVTRKENAPATKSWAHFVAGG